MTQVERKVLGRDLKKDDMITGILTELGPASFGKRYRVEKVSESANQFGTPRMRVDYTCDGYMGQFSPDRDAMFLVL